MDHKFKFTIVMPVYKVEEFIDEAVQSVINQKIGIENIQLLLIDDGSPDNCGKICDDYAKQYPNNIFAVHKPNGGLSSARNAGLDLTEGKYVTFTDPDDILPPNALSEVWKFFEAHYDETDITAIKLIYFDGKKGNHYLNYKFSKENRVENLKENWDCPHMSVASAFIKTEAIGDLRFDDRLSFAEDGLFSQTIIMEKQTIGLVSSTQYNYRIRLTGSNSLIQGSAYNPKWYLPTLKYYHIHLINKAKERFGFIPKYLQMVLMYELQWRFKRAQLSTGVLTEEEEQEYYTLICDIAKNIDDDVIDAQRYIWRDIKLFVMSLKYDRRPPDVVEFEDELLLQYSPEAAYKISNNTVNFDFVELENGKVTVEGYTLLPLLGDKDVKLHILVNGKEIPHKHFQRNIFDVSLTNAIQNNYSFSTCFDIDENQRKYKIQVAIEVNGKTVVMRKHVYRQHVRFDHRNTASYMYKDG
ncbi:MAG: glycosyltransferase family 2 protein, partial [Clostridia bacterium]|nr:glycosyltransferase family 2 protein [Clostridia bacterium]